ncbi:glutamine amidotransferase [Actinoplanes sp. SE50]|uniref:type 1 glutamine amidotransferase n=1 Tax=unclassified Actinoplanes TaxID=2626549 RepID=UPI00023EC3EA|nr:MULTISPECIES: type 1 glutamine amidotransferase [unclassified Actinoplanes]AEV82466.1 GMP synthase [Actinoplanes sp. SE50/110]ATO80863.1 glutamine amidotransferase [Actinoplanes sp. SE50]SLL98270.1 glutamine amidotransferase [Actinoplanes sp. SE50/110]
MRTALVIENDPTDDLRRLGEWLTEAGLELTVLRPHAGDDLPETLDDFAALIVLGGDQSAYPDAAGAPGAPWFPALEGLFRKAVRNRVPTLGVCLGGQLLASAHGGLVERSPAGPEIGPGLVGKRDAADTDPLFQWVPLLPDVIQWHRDEITELPLSATLLAASSRYPHQAFRIGDRAWGLQFHIECDAAMMADWVRLGAADLDELGYDGEAVVHAVAGILPDVEEVWQPFAARFAALALGQLPDAGMPKTLPLLGQ